MMNDIAIIIPAYKDSYLEYALKSIASQDLTHCHVYIGDDASPYPIANIVSKFEKLMPISYTRFEDNLGGRDLVAQWNRCVGLAKGEKWIWLFSDDDVMCDDCIRKVYDYIELHDEDCDVYHINGTIVDNSLKDITWESINDFPEYLSTSEYVEHIIERKDNTWGVNFIVRRAKLLEDKGFVNFDLAWNADHASWLQFSYPKGIMTVPTARIFWRYSGKNITSLRSDKKLIKRKAISRVTYLKWLYCFMKSRHLTIETSWADRTRYLAGCFVTDSHASLLTALSVLLRSSRYIYPL